MLKLCECAARNLEPDLTNVEDASMILMKGAYERLCSKIQYLLPRASAAWKPEFEKALDSCHSIRVETIEVSRKDTLRKVPGVCMACGRTEQNCRYSIDMAGTHNSNEWLQNPLNVVHEYAKFLEEYDSVHAKGFVSACKRSKKLPSVDKGCFVVGETCLRKAKLRYSLQTLLLESCYASERDLEEMSGESTEFRPDTMYTTGDERCTDFVDTQDRIELAVADERRPVPEIATDHDFWDIIDECRNAVSGGDQDCFNAIIRERAHETLSRAESVCRKRKQRYEKEASVTCSEDDEEESDDGDQHVRYRNNRRGVRTCIIESDNEEEETGERRVGRALSSMVLRRRGGAHASSEAAGSSLLTERSHVSAHEASEPVDRGGPADHEEDDPAADSPAINNPAPRGRSVPPSISGIVGMRRATGALPSRTDALVQLMELQVRLAKADKHSDAAVCTNAILTLQELIQRVKDLQHTSGI